MQYHWVFALLLDRRWRNAAEWWQGSLWTNSLTHRQSLPDSGTRGCSAGYHYMCIHSKRISLSVKSLPFVPLSQCVVDYYSLFSYHHNLNSMFYTRHREECLLHEAILSTSPLIIIMCPNRQKGSGNDSSLITNSRCMTCLSSWLESGTWVVCI